MESAGRISAVLKGDSVLNGIRFMLVCSVFFVVAVLVPDRFFDPLNRATAALSGLCIGLFGDQATVAGDVISLNGFQVRIITECTPLFSMILLSSFIFSVAASLKSKVAGLLLGLPFLASVNTLRIALITLIGARHPAFFELAHVYLAQVVMVILVVATAFAWLRLTTRSEEMNMPFLLRAFAMASIIFIPWLILNETYVKMLDYVTSGMFSLADYRLFIPYGRHVYFQTFNTVIFLALICAERRLTPGRRAACAVAGVAILAGVHLLFRIGNVLLTAFSWHPALPITISLTVIGEYLLPLILWLAAIRTCRDRA